MIDLNLDRKQSKEIKKNIFILIFLIFGMIYLSFMNYFIFHTLVEVFCTLIGLGITIIVLNTYTLGINDQFALLGIAYIFISVFNFLHTLSYIGLNILTPNTMNLSVQLAAVKWYIESISFLITFVFLNKKIKPAIIVLLYLILSVTLLLCICFLDIFPQCYLGGTGQAIFKIISECISTVIFIFAMIFLVKNKKSLETNTYQLILFSMILKIGAQLSLLFYQDLNTIPHICFHMLSHIFKLFSFYLIYKAIIETGLKKPYALLKEEIIERKKLHEELLKEKEILNAILDATADGILVVSKDREVIHSNKRFAEMWCIPPEFLETNQNEALIHFITNQMNVSDECICNMLKAADTLNEHIDCIPFKDGKVFEHLCRPLIIKRDVYGIVCSFRDITEKTRAEELENKVIEKNKLLDETIEYDRLKTEFFSNISHELKTPLNIILGGVQLLDKMHSKYTTCTYYSSFEKYIKIMNQNCYRLLRLMNNLIDITRMDSGFLSMNFNNYNIINVIEDITLSVAEFIQSKNITLIFDTDVEEKIIACDVNKLERVMLNLLSNAVKFTEENGKIEVNIYDKKDRILISVKDTGIGIPENMLEKIFERFRQVDSSLHRKREGSGIGLSLVKSIIHCHGGSITAKSEYGQGSEFIIELPVHLVDEDSPTEEEAAVCRETNVEKIHIEFSDIYS